MAAKQSLKIKEKKPKNGKMGQKHLGACPCVRFFKTTLNNKNKQKRDSSGKSHKIEVLELERPINFLNFLEKNEYVSQPQREPERVKDGICSDYGYQSKQEENDDSGPCWKKVELREIISHKLGEEEAVSGPKIKRKIQITRIPKVGSGLPFLVTFFNNFAKSGQMDETEITRAVNITDKAKKDLDEGKQWNGPIEIAENLKLKLYKSGLVLCHKK